MFFSTHHLSTYRAAHGVALEQWRTAPGKPGAAVDTAYSIKASAVFSANIEGNTMDLSSFMNSITAQQPFKPRRDAQEIEDLVAAYEFARAQPLNERNLLAVHRLLSRTLLIREKRGKYRTDRMGVFDVHGLVYLAVESDLVKGEMRQLLKELAGLQARELDVVEAFYHAAQAHLRLAHIHPFWDGNGRTARLLEKWFLAHFFSERAWQLPSEKYYRDHLEDYYRNINLGMSYHDLDYSRSLPFLNMLAAAATQ